jgi:hypothetical protein
MCTQPSDNPYAAPLAPGAAYTNSSAERPKRSAFVWSGFGFWSSMLAFLLFGQTITWISGDDTGDGREVFVFVAGGPVLTSLFAAIYSLWWRIRTWKADLRPTRIRHFVHGASGVLTMMVLAFAVLLVADRLPSFADSLFFLSVLLSPIISAEFCRLLTRSSSSKLQDNSEMSSTRQRRDGDAV